MPVLLVTLLAPPVNSIVTVSAVPSAMPIPGHFFKPPNVGATARHGLLQLTCLGRPNDCSKRMFLARVGVHDRSTKRRFASCTRWRTPTQVGESCADPSGALRSDGQPLQTGAEVRQS